MKVLLLSGLSLASGVAYAAGNGQGSAMDLIPGFLNLSILLVILFLILKKPVKEHYQAKSDSVKNVLERASVKAKEAEMMMQAQQKKIDGVADEIDRLYKDTDESIAKYKVEYAATVDERIAKMKEDAASKIEAEKTEQINKLNSSFLDEVISKAKVTIKANPELSNEATNKALEGIK